MKKIALFLVLASGTHVFAAGYGAAGCGFGAIVFAGKNDKVSQVLAATTNGTAGSQTFGISTGTLNCDTGRLKISKTSFIEANKFALANDIARGEGETLAALTNLYGCSNVQSASANLKANYGKIFDSANPSAENLDGKFSRYMKACI